MQKLTAILVVSLFVLLFVAASADAGRAWSEWGAVGKIGRGRNRGDLSRDNYGRGRGKGKWRKSWRKGRKRGRGKKGRLGKKRCGLNAHWDVLGCVCNRGCSGNPYKLCINRGRKGY